MRKIVMVVQTFFKNKRVTVFGLGLNGGGVAIVKFLAQAGVKEIIVTDIKKRSELEASIIQLKGIKNITFVLAQHRPEDFTRTDMVIINPGIPWTNEYVKLALKKNIPVEMDASIFFQLCKQPIIGVTGTKGKTTTSTLLTEMLKDAGYHVVRAGIGQTPVLNALSELKPKSVVVFELSSWRLSSLAHIKKSPHIALFTNFFPDHLNYYKNMASYLQDKKYIFAFQKKTDWIIANQQITVLASALKTMPSKAIFFNDGNHTSEDIEAYASNPHIFLEDNSIMISFEDDSQKIMAVDEIALRGKHNIGNVLAAIAGALAFGVEAKSIRKTVMKFASVPHRLEWVREKNGVKYYNDTAATVPQATVQALASFDEPIILIAGGNNKGLNFEEVAESIQSKTKSVIFFQGEATDKILKYLHKHFPEDKRWQEPCIVTSMVEAIREASLQAEKGDVVLLSPGATSFGLFKNEFDRGEQFRATVKKL
jgi:UDP-N-acetylmuramoylalanine--D-glutamate ligase